MAWYAERADEQFWHDYWKQRLSPSYYQSIRRANIKADELGALLVSEMSPMGVHIEAGCGAGYWVAALQNYGLNVEGIEYSRDLVELVHSINPELPIRCGDALNIDCPPNYYDSYISLGVVEHRFAGPEPFLREAYRVLKPRGKILISVPFFGAIRRYKSRMGFYDRNTPGLPFFQYGFTLAEFSNLITCVGFEISRAVSLQVHRMMIEEFPFYRWLSYQKGGRAARKIIESILGGRDGHMLFVVGYKPAM